MALEKLGLEVIVEGLKKFQSDMAKADDAVEESSKKYSKLGKLAQGAGKVLSSAVTGGAQAAATAGLAAAAAVGSLVAVIGKLALEAAPIKGVERAFDGLTSTFEGGSKAMLVALQEGSSGMIANRDLMMSYNQAAQLVGKSFAEQLPDAMQYLSKVSAATGQDMGYMMDSLVKGIGRLSPMILDNLGIQVNLTEANEAYAKSIGKSVDELTKSEQQTALMNATLEKLRDNTADMPEVTGSATSLMAQWQTTVQNLKDTIGTAFLPVLELLFTKINDFADKVGPKITEWAEKVEPWLRDNLPRAVEALSALFEGDLSKAIDYVAAIISTTFGRDKAVQFYEFVNKVREGIAQIMERINRFIEPIRAKFEQYWPIIQAVVLTAWEVIQDIIQAAAEVIVPVVQEFVEQIRGHLESFTPVIEALKELWESLKPVVGVVLAAIGALVLAAVGIVVGLFKGLMGALGPIINGIAGILEGIITALKGVIDFVVGFVELIISLFQKNEEGTTAAWEKMKKGLVDIVTGLWNAIRSLFEGAFDAIMELIGGFVSGVIDFFTNLYDNLVGKSIIIDMMADMLKAITDGFAKIIQAVKDKIAEIITNIADKVIEFYNVGKDLIEGLAKGIREAVKDLLRKVGDWIADIVDEAKKRAGISSPSAVFAQIGRDMMAGLELGLAGMLPAVQAQVNAAVAGGGSSTTYNNATYNYNLTTQSTTQPGGLKLEFSSMAMASR